MLRKFFILVLFLLILVLSPKITYAASNSFVNIVNPVRGNDFWEDKNQKPKDAVLGELDILNSNNLLATWLIRPDVFNDQQSLNILKNASLNTRWDYF